MVSGAKFGIRLSILSDVAIRSGHWNKKVTLNISTDIKPPFDGHTFHKSSLFLLGGKYMNYHIVNNRFAISVCSYERSII